MEEWRNAHLERRTVDFVALSARHQGREPEIYHRDNNTETRRDSAITRRWRRGATYRGAASTVEGAVIRLREVGSGLTYYRPTLLADHARPRREQFLFRDYPSRAICNPEGGGIRSRGSNESHVSRSRQRRVIIRRPPPPRAAQHDRPAATSSTRNLYVCVCVYLDKRVRNASLAIYVLRHTSSLALAPTAHPSWLQRPLPRPLGGRLPAPYVRSFLSPSTDSPAPRHVAPASTDRPFRSTISVGSCHHRTGLRTPDDTAPINRDPVSSPADTFFRLATLVPAARVNLVRSVLSALESAVAFIDSFTTWQRTYVVTYVLELTQMIVSYE